MTACVWCWCGQVEQQARNIELFSRLSGTFVGKLKKPDKSLSAFDQVRNLQRQSFLLCGHPTRSLEDILFFGKEGKQVGPLDLAYRSELNCDESTKVLKLLEQPSLTMMYDETDGYAKSVLDREGIHHNMGPCVSFNKVGILTLPTRGDVQLPICIPKEARYLAKLGVTQWVVLTNEADYWCDVCVDFGFLDVQVPCTHLMLQGIKPVNLHVRATRVTMKKFSFDLNDFEGLGLDMVEVLDLQTMRPQTLFLQDPIYNYQGLKHLATLKELCIYADIQPKGAGQLVATLADMKHVKRFTFQGGAPPSFQTQLGSLTHVVAKTYVLDYKVSTKVKFMFFGTLGLLGGIFAVIVFFLGWLLYISCVYLLGFTPFWFQALAKLAISFLVLHVASLTVIDLIQLRCAKHGW
jgi:hypothetical protein